MPIYESTKLTDELHRIFGFETDYEFITKRKMKEVQKLSKQPAKKSKKFILQPQKDYIIKRNNTAQKAL